MSEPTALEGHCPHCSTPFAIPLVYGPREGHYLTTEPRCAACNQDVQRIAG